MSSMSFLFHVLPGSRKKRGYMISGFRYGFLGINDVPLVTTFGVLVVFIVAFYLICWSLIQRGRGLRS